MSYTWWDEKKWILFYGMEKGVWNSDSWLLEIPIWDHREKFFEAFLNFRVKYFKKFIVIFSKKNFKSWNSNIPR